MHRAQNTLRLTEFDKIMPTSKWNCAGHDAAIIEMRPTAAAHQYLAMASMLHMCMSKNTIFQIIKICVAFNTVREPKKNFAAKFRSSLVRTVCFDDINWLAQKGSLEIVECPSLPTTTIVDSEATKTWRSGEEGSRSAN